MVALFVLCFTDVCYCLYSSYFICIFLLLLWWGGGSTRSATKIITYLRHSRGNRYIFKRSPKCDPKAFRAGVRVLFVFVLCVLLVLLVFVFCVFVCLLFIVCLVFLCFYVLSLCFLYVFVLFLRTCPCFLYLSLLFIVLLYIGIYIYI